MCAQPLKHVCHITTPPITFHFYGGKRHYRLCLSALKRRTIWQLVDGISRGRFGQMCEGLVRQGVEGLKTVTANGRYPSRHSITIIHESPKCSFGEARPEVSDYCECYCTLPRTHSHPRSHLAGTVRGK